MEFNENEDRAMFRLGLMAGLLLLVTWYVTYYGITYSTHSDLWRSVFAGLGALTGILLIGSMMSSALGRTSANSSRFFFKTGAVFLIVLLMAFAVVVILRDPYSL